LNAFGVSDIRQTEMHVAEPLVSEPSPFKVEISVEKLRRYNLPGSDQISSVMIQAEDNTSRSEIHSFISSIWNKEELSQQ
jgi:hypothetical protein